MKRSCVPLTSGGFLVIVEDLRRKAAWLYGGEQPRLILKALCTDGSFAMVWYRVMQWSTRNRLAPLAMICNKLNGVFCQCIIGRGAEFGPGFVLVHAQGVVINGDVRGGRDIYVEHQVTIGAEKNRSPRLGSRIFIGAGAKIIGPVTIGDDVKIGANAVVVSDVPSNVSVGGVPARILTSRQ